MAVTNAWKRRCALVIDYTKVVEDLTNFPVLLNKDNVPSEMLDADGAYACKSDGSDIRITTDYLGLNECPLEVVVCTLDNNPASSLLEIHTKLPSVSSSVNTTFYLWYRNPAASAYAATDTYGRNAVWNNGYRGVWHLQSISSVDSTGIHTTATPKADSRTGAGIIQNGLDIYKVVDVYTGVPHNLASSLARTDSGNDPLWTADHGFSFEVWAKTSSTFDPDDISGYTKWHTFMNRGGSSDADVEYRFRWGTRDATNGRLNLSYKNGSSSTNTLINTVIGNFTASTQYYIGLKVTKNDASNRKALWVVRDGSGFRAETESATVDAPVACSSDRAIEIGAHSNDSFCDWTDDGQILDEFRISAIDRSEGWLKTTYATIASPSTFITEGTPESVPMDSRNVYAGINRGVRVGINTINI